MKCRSLSIGIRPLAELPYGFRQVCSVVDSIEQGHRRHSMRLLTMVGSAGIDCRIVPPPFLDHFGLAIRRDSIVG
jgi:hypothetical protein